MSEWNNMLETTLRALREDPDLGEPKKKQLMEKIQRESAPVLQSDKWIYRIVVGSLGLAILLTIIFSFFIFYSGAQAGKEPKIPDLFLALGSAAVGALAGLLAPSPNSKN